MNNRFYNFLVIVIVSLFLFSPCQSEVKSPESAVESNSIETLAPAEAGKAEVNEPVAIPVLESKIKFDNVTHDFGQVAPGSYNDCKFVFTNVGEGILHVDHAKGSCKCTVPELKKKDYAPGESGEINVKYHAPKYSGNASQPVTVFSNDPENSKLQLTIKAYVKSEVEVTPEQMTLSLLEPNAGAGEITLTSVDGEKFSVTKIISPGDVISIDFDPNNISDKHVFKPVVNMDSLPKYLNSYIVFELSHPKAQSVRVQYSCLKKFETSPTVIILRNAVAGQAEERLIYLTSNYNLPIKVESVTSDDETVKVISQEKTENRFEFKVEITPPARQGKLRIFSDVIHIKIKGADEITIPCRGFYVSDK